MSDESSADATPDEIRQFKDPVFVHLRLHTAYSLLEGAVRVPDLAGRCQAMDMPAVAVTDTGNLFGALEFSEKLSGAGVTP